MIRCILNTSKNKWLCFVYCCSLWISHTSSQKEEVSQYFHDQKTTYCFQSSANIYESNVTQDQILFKEKNETCPFFLTLSLEKQNVNVDEMLTVQWTISSNPTFLLLGPTDSSILDSLNLPFAKDPKTQVNANIIHSNLHSCAFGTECDPFTKGKHNTDPTMNQIANFTIQPQEKQQQQQQQQQLTAVFHSSNEMKFFSAGKYSLFAHMILPGEKNNPDTFRYDYAIFTTINVEQKVESILDQNLQRKSRSFSSIELIFVAVIGSIVIGFGIVGLYVLFKDQRRRRRRNKTRKKQQQHPYPHTGTERIDDIKVERILPLLTPSLNHSQPSHSHHSPLHGRNGNDDGGGGDDDSGHGTGSTNRKNQTSSDWKGLYSSNDILPPSILIDDQSTSAILCASRKSSPTRSPKRHVADFTRDIPYWDVRLSASPITPGSGAFFTNMSSVTSSPVEDLESNLAMLEGTDEIFSCIKFSTKSERFLLPPGKHISREITSDSSEDELEIDI